MKSLNVALLLLVSIFAIAPTVSFAQVPDDVQSNLPTPVSGPSREERAKLAAERRTLEIESARSDINDLSKFEHDHGYLPKFFYKRSYAVSNEQQMVAGKNKPSF